MVSMGVYKEALLPVPACLSPDGIGGSKLAAPLSPGRWEFAPTAGLLLKALPCAATRASPNSPRSFSAFAAAAAARASLC